MSRERKNILLVTGMLLVSLLMFLTLFVAKNSGLLELNLFYIISVTLESFIFALIFLYYVMSYFSAVEIFSDSYRKNLYCIGVIFLTSLLTLMLISFANETYLIM